MTDRIREIAEKALLKGFVSGKHPAIESAIRQAVSTLEAQNEAYKIILDQCTEIVGIETTYGSIPDAINDRVSKARQEAYEDAAKVCDEISMRWPLNSTADNVLADARAAIRARRKRGRDAKLLSLRTVLPTCCLEDALLRISSRTRPRGLYVRQVSI